MRHTKSRLRKHSVGQGDHVDAWLMSYADMITLLFMLFAIFVSVSVSKNHSASVTNDPKFVSDHYGLLDMATPYDAMYRSVGAVIASHDAGQNIAIERTENGVLIDISAIQFFDRGSADIPVDQMPLLQSIARALKASLPENYVIEVEGHTDDEPLQNGKFANNWELSAMQATHVINLLIDAGIDPARMHAASYASNKPLVPNNDIAGNPIEQNRMRNQRIVIKVERQAA